MQVYVLSMLGIPVQYAELVIWVLKMEAAEYPMMVVIYSVLNPY